MWQPRSFPGWHRPPLGAGRHLDEPSRRAYRAGIGRQGLRAFHDYLRDARNCEALYEQVESALTGPLRGLPLLTIFGERNDPLGFQPRWKGLLADAHQVVVAKGNHYPMCDDPDLVARTIRWWHRERQIFRRAQQHVTQERPRFDVSPQEQQKLLREFLEATSLGDRQGLLALLSKDVVLYTDGGGKATAVPNPVYGPDRVARFFLGARGKLIPKDVVRRFAEINGQPGIVAYHHGRVFGIFTMGVVEGRIRNIYIVSNPDKLERLPNLPPTPC